ncbi:MAG: hypothetical protein Q8M03_12350, partial [Legionella sp.]|nr:hypothetical protein [Legionella sp.]
SPSPSLSPSAVEEMEESEEKIIGRKRKFEVLDQSDKMTLRDRMTLFVQKEGYNPLNSEVFLLRQGLQKKELKSVTSPVVLAISIKL